MVHLFCFLFLFLINTQAWASGGVLGVDATLASGVHAPTGYTTNYGISARTHITYFFTKAVYFGPMLHLDIPGIVFYPTATIGGAIRTPGSNVYFELGGGLAYSAIWGPDFSIIPSVGIRIVNQFYISFPIVLKFLRGIEFTPYLGFRFGGGKR